MEVRQLKFKIKHNNNQTIVHVSIEKNETVSEKDIAMIAQYPVKGIFIPQLKNGGMFNKTMIECVAPRSIPLAQYFGNIIQRGHFYFLLAQIVAVIGRLQQRNIPPNNIILDMRYIFVNPQNHELKFLYIPMVSVRSYADILGFIKAIVNAAKPSPQENCGYYYEFIDFCSKQKFFSLDAFTRFLVERDQNASIILRDIMIPSQQNLQNNQQFVNNYGQYQQPSGMQQTAEDDRTLLINEESAAQGNNSNMTGQQHYGNDISPEERGTELLNMPVQDASSEPEYLPEEHLASLPKDRETVLINPDESDDDYVPVSDFKPKPLIPPIVGFKPAPVNTAPTSISEVKSDEISQSKPEIEPERKAVPEFNPELIPQLKPEIEPERKAVPEFKPESIPQLKPEIEPERKAVPEFKPESIQTSTVESDPEPFKKMENKLNIPDVTPPPFTPINDYVHYPEDEEEIGGTVLLSSIDNPFKQNIQPKNPRLIRKRNNQEFPINKPIYRIGKERKFVDGYITGNTAISRTHAEIATRNNRYFITDLHSTNFTYINHSIIARETETEFYDGDIITLADEDFLFKT